MSLSMLLLAVGTLAVFVGLFVALAAVALSDNQGHGVSKSLAVVEAFSTAPKPLQDQLQPSFNDRVLVPLLTRFVTLGKKLTPEDYGDRIRQKLDVAGNPEGMTVDRVVALKVVGFGGMLVVSLAYALMLDLSIGASILMGTVAAMAGYFGPNVYLYNKGAKRTATMRKTFPDAIDLLTISVEAGLGFDAALSQVARNTPGPLAEEFARVLQEMQIGLGRSQALRALGNRTTLAEMRGFVSAMTQADAFGIPVGQVLRVQASEIRVKRRQRAEEQAQKLPVKVLFPVMFCILPTLFIVVMGPAAITVAEMFSSM